MKSRSIVGIILTVVGVVAVVVAFFPKTLVSEPQEGFGPLQTTAVIVGVILMVLGYMLCCSKSACACKTCEPKPEEKPEEMPQETPPGT